MRKSVIVGFARTAFGKFGGKLKSFQAIDLGGFALKEAISRSEIESESLDLVIMGQVLSGGCGQCPARQAAIKANIPLSIPAESINKVCASSLRAVTLADQIIRSGDANFIATGGMESMSNAPYLSYDMRFGHKMGNIEFVDMMIKDGLWCPKYDCHMAVHGGKVALSNGITREMQDMWSVESQKRASTAINTGKLDREIVSIVLPDDEFFNKDESPRPNTTLVGLSKLSPIFWSGNTITPGNAPGVNDGGSAIIVADETTAIKRKLNIEATIIGYAMYSDDPQNIATVPGYAIKKLLDKVGMTSDDIDLYEINEAFAAVTLLSAKIVGCDLSIVNVNGGAVAFGHPIGASGGRILMTLISELQRRNVRYGIAAICSGMGQGDAVLIENYKYSS